MKHVLGVKSSGYLGMNIFGFIILFLVIVLLVIFDVGLDENQQRIIFFLMACAIYLIIDILIYSRKPSTLISYDEDNLYLHYVGHTKTIPLHQIKQAIPRRMRASTVVAYSFGKILIYTSIDVFRIGVISDVESVCINLMDIVRKHVEHK